ncbi:MAG: CdaR family protein [Cloacibacillus sp.]
MRKFGLSSFTKKFKEFDKKISEASGSFNYKGESFLQSKLFLGGVSLFMSIFLWSFVALDGNSDAARTITAEIKYTNLPKGVSYYTKDRRVEVKVVGRINTLSSVGPSDIVAEVSLAELQPGKYNLPIRIEVPSFARLRSWQPSMAEVEIYRHVERTLTLTPMPEGLPPDGTVIGSIDLSPSKAVISGPESDVMAIQSLEAAIALDRLDKNGSVTAPIILRGAATTFAGESAKGRLTITPSETKAKVVFENEIAGERIPVKVSVVGQPQEGLQVESIKVIPDSVSIRGRSAAVRKMQSLALPPVDISGLDQNIQLMIPMQPAKLDPDVEITGTDRARVEIKLSKKMGVKTFVNVPLMVEGEDVGKEWRLAPQSVSVSVEGPVLDIDGLTGAHAPCELYIDVSNIVSKQAQLPVLVKNLKRNFQIVKIEPEQIAASVID